MAKKQRCKLDIILYCYLLHLLEFTAGHCSQGIPQALPREQQQEDLETPTPISLLQATSPLSPRGLISK